MHLQVDNEGVVDLCQDVLLQFDVVDLLQVDYLSLFERLQSDRFPVEQRQVYLPKCARSNDPDQVEVGDLAVGVLYVSPRELSATVASPTRHH